MPCPSNSLYPSDSLYPNSSDCVESGNPYETGSGQTADPLPPTPSQAIAGIFPEDIFISFPIDVRASFIVSNLMMSDGLEKRVLGHGFAKRTVTLSHKHIRESEIATLYDFFTKQKGAAKKFKFIIPIEASHYNEFVGIGDGSTTNFDLPSKGATHSTVYIDGSPSSYNYSISNGAGAFGVDRISFESAPQKGEVITHDFFGRLVIDAFFRDEMMTSEQFFYRLHNAGIVIIEA